MMIELLQYIVRTAYKTQETLKTLNIYEESPQDPNISNLNILLDAVKIHSVKAVLEQTNDVDIRKFERSLSSLCEIIKAIEEIYPKLDIPSSVPGYLKDRLDTNIRGLKKLFEQLTPLMTKAI